MGDSDVGLFFKLKADAGGVSTGTAEAKAALSGLTGSFNSELSKMTRLSEGAFEEVGKHIHANITERIPLIGGAFLRVSENIKGFGEEAAKQEGNLLKLGAAVESIASKTGRTQAEVAGFLTPFAKLESQAQRDAAALGFFGASATKVEGDLRAARTELTAFGSEGEKAGGALSSLGGFAGVTAVALLAVAAAAVGVSVAIFEIVKKSAEAGLELEHLKEQTGLSAQTITALKFASDESGKSMEGLGRGMKLFELLADNAANGSKHAEATLKALGTTSHEVLTDLDGALGKVFQKIYEADNPIAKAGLAAAAFGKRIGTDLIPLIESFHGNLGELIKRADELGVTLDEKGIHSLANFQKNMNALQAQAQGLERTFAAEVAPALTDALKSISISLSENKEEFKTWGREVAQIFRGIHAVAKDPEFLITIKQITDVLKVASYVLSGGLVFVGEKVVKAIAGKVYAKGALPASPVGPTLQTMIEELPIHPPRGGSGLPVGEGKGGAAGESAAHALTMKQIADEKAAIAGIEAATQVATDALKHAYAERLVGFTEYIAGERAANEKRKQESFADISLEQGRLAQALKRKTISQKEFDDANRNLLEQATKINSESHKKNTELDQEEYTERIRLLKEFRADTEAINQAHEDAYLQILKEGVADRLITESQYLQAEAEAELNRNLRKKQALQDEITDIAKHVAEVNHLSLAEASGTKVVTDAVSERKLKFELLENERVEIARRTAKAIIDAANAEALEENNRKAGGDAKPGGTRVRSVVQTAIATDAFKQFDDALKEHLSGDKLTEATAGLQVMSSAFQQVGQAVGDAVHSFVLLGSAGIGLRKFTAEVIANIAQMAAVQAIWELAQAAAMFAMNFFWPDPKLVASGTEHLHAAAIYGGLAVIATGAGRAVAGGAFSQEGSASGSSSISGSGAGSGAGSPAGRGGSSTPSQTPIINVGRSQAPAPVIQVHIHGEAAAAFNYKVKQVLVNGLEHNDERMVKLLKRTVGK